MKNDSRKYYENFDWVSTKLAERIQDKVNILLSSFPADVDSVLDVGCGDGSITNGLKNKFNLVATDRSINALQFLNTKIFCSSADNLPIKNESFDLVFSSEMIEHLPDDVFNKTITEFKRTTKKYIYLTFPNNENVEKNFVKCHNCGLIFNKIYHLRKLNLNIIADLFPEYQMIYKTDHGVKIKQYNKKLAKFKHNFVSSNSWIPLRWTPNNQRRTMCPECSTSFDIPFKFSLLGFIIDGINTLISPRLPYQQFVLLKKRNVV